MNQRTAAWTLVSLLAAALALPAGAVAHFPPTPDPTCTPRAADHDIIGPQSVSVAAMGREMDVGEAILIDGSTACPSAPTCVDLPIVGKVCTPANAVGSDDEYEMGIGGAFLPANHHRLNSIPMRVSPFGPEFAFRVGSDGDGDGIVNGAAAADCLGPRQVVTAFTLYVVPCPAGADHGWYVFAACYLDTNDNGQIVEGPDGPLLTDANGDGIPDGVNPAWDPPTIVPPTTVAPEQACSLGAHVG